MNVECGLQLKKEKLYKQICFVKIALTNSFATSNTINLVALNILLKIERQEMSDKNWATKTVVVGQSRGGCCW